MERRFLRPMMPIPAALRVGLLLALLVLAHFTLMHGIGSTVLPGPAHVRPAMIVMADAHADAHAVVGQAVRDAMDACPLTTVRLESEPPPPLLALLATTAILVLGFARTRPMPYIAPLALPSGPARQALLQRFTL